MNPVVMPIGKNFEASKKQQIAAFDECCVNVHPNPTPGFPNVFGKAPWCAQFLSLLSEHHYIPH